MTINIEYAEAAKKTHKYMQDRESEEMPEEFEIAKKRINQIKEENTVAELRESIRRKTAHILREKDGIKDIEIQNLEKRFSQEDYAAIWYATVVTTAQNSVLRRQLDACRSEREKLNKQLRYKGVFGKLCKLYDRLFA